MRSVTVMLAVCALVLGAADTGWAQNEGVRPAMTTFLGDTGLWFVPTGEVLPKGDLSVSVHRNEFDFRQGDTNVSFWPLTGAVGVGSAEIFASLRVVTRIDRDTTPLLFAGPDDQSGGLINDYPRVNSSWTGNKLGDLFVGGKVSMLSQARQQPFALAARGIVKFPTGDDVSGVGTGEYDGFADLIGSREFGRVEVSGFGGWAWRGDPDNISISDSIRWGVGGGFPSRYPLRATAELHGEHMLDDAVTAPVGAVVATDGSLSPSTSSLQNNINMTLGLTWQHPRGLLLGAAFNYRWDVQTDLQSGLPPHDIGDAYSVQFRIGWHGGVRTYVPPPPTIAFAPAPGPVATTGEAPPNRMPTVRAYCNPCALAGGGVASLRAEATDPDGDPLTLRWSTPGGTLTDSHAAVTNWRAETTPGSVTLTVEANDGRGGVATDTVTIEVTGDEEVAFEDVHFDFDKYVLRPEMIQLLEPAVATLKTRPGMRMTIEGHTCDIGTSEYNMALGERRANAVKTYLIQRGIGAERLTTVSYGEEKPAHSNLHAEGRALNRRAVLVVRLENDSQ